MRSVGVGRRDFLFVGAEPNQVHEFQDAERVDDEKGYEPFLLPITCRMPESIALDDDGPEHDHDKKRHQREHQSWRIR